MDSITQFDLVGKTFRIRIPQTNSDDSPCWLCQCIIDTVTETTIHVYFTCQDWLATSFDLPVPRDLDNVYHCIYLSCCEIVAQERIEYLCTL